MHKDWNNEPMTYIFSLMLAVEAERSKPTDTELSKKHAGTKCVCLYYMHTQLTQEVEVHR